MRGLKQKYRVKYKLDDEHKIEYSLKTLQAELYASGFKLKNVEIKWGEIYVSAYKT